MWVKEETLTDSFMGFQKKVHAYVLANYKHPSNIAYLVKLFKGTLPRMMSTLPPSTS